MATACNGNKSNNNSSNNSEPVIDFNEDEFAESLPKRDRLALRCQNKTNTNYATYEASYSEKGVTITSYLYDSDLYARNIYDIGYDDNIEFVIGKKTDRSGWIKGETFHFLMNGSGKTYFQTAVSSSSFGVNLDPSLHAVVGENYIYHFELLDSKEIGIGGFKCEVFFTYDLLNTSYAESYGNLTICPGMRNTHIYSTDTAWASYSEKGCNWSNASSFVLIGKNGVFGDKISLDFETLIIGDTYISPSNWITFSDDFTDGSVVNIAETNSNIAYWKNELTNYSECTASNILMYVGSNDLVSKQTDVVVNNIKELIQQVHTMFNDAGVYYLGIINNNELGSKINDAQEINNAIKTYSSSDNRLTYVDTSKMNDGSGVRKGLFSIDGTFNYLGSALLSSIVRETLNIVDNELPSGFGKNSMYASSSGYRIGKDGSQDIIIGSGDRDQYLISSQEPNINIDFSLSFSAKRVFNNDAYPKFGLVLIGNENVLFFYVDGSQGLSKQTIGYVKGRQNSNWIWANSVERDASISYSGNNYVEMSVVKNGNQIVLGVNADDVFTVNNFFEENEKVTQGALSFNTNLYIKY